MAVVFGLLFLASAGFGVWAFMGMQDYKNNVEPKIEAAVEVAKQETSTAKDNEFLEKEKLPTKEYKGPDTYGGVSFVYPKTWSMVTAKTTASVPLDATLHPGAVPGSGNDGDFSYAFRVSVLNAPYERTVKEYDASLKSGKLIASPIRLAAVPSVLGTRMDGEVVRGKNGSVILLPLRDKTLKVWTESNDYKPDFNNIILPSLTFQP